MDPSFAAARTAPQTAPPTFGTRQASLILAGYVLVTSNASFWKALWQALDRDAATNLPLLGGIALALLMLFWTIFSLCAWRHIAKPAWIALLVLSAGAAYFMDSYGLVVDRIAIQSVLETDLREAAEWSSWRMLPYLLIAILPSLWLLRIRIAFRPWPVELGRTAGVVALAVALIAGCVFFGFARLSSVARNHRELQHLINPTTVLQSAYGNLRRRVAPRPTSVMAIDTDAQRGPSWSNGNRPRILVLVVGESARASSFSLLGYARDTNPTLAHEPVLGFDNVRSCGTSTAVSLPCMFSDLGAAHYSDLEARGRESLLDVLGHAGVRSLWLDNNTGSKGVAARSGQISVADAADPRYCNAVGCYDDILADRLRNILDGESPPEVIVLHQKGSHGPSYHERYPAQFRRFQPTCESNDLDDCTRAQIVNTYDNSIAYTDHNLGEIISALRERTARFDSAMLYVSDHGESTGEKGMYLHGAPTFMAPDEQTRVPMLLWLSEGFESRFGIDRACLGAAHSRQLSHDNLFHSVLGLMDVATRGYRAERDLFSACRIDPAIDSGTRTASQ